MDSGLRGRRGSWGGFPARLRHSETRSWTGTAHPQSFPSALACHSPTCGWTAQVHHSLVPCTSQLDYFAFPKLKSKTATNRKPRCTVRGYLQHPEEVSHAHGKLVWRGRVPSAVHRVDLPALVHVSHRIEGPLGLTE